MAAGYNQAALRQIIFRNDDTGRLDVPLALRRTADQKSFNTLVRLFFLGQSVPRTEAHAAFEPMPVEPLIEIGLLESIDDSLCSRAMLVPLDDLFVAYDFPMEVTGEPEPRDYVLGVGRASITLANLTVRRQNEVVLDLGTGSGCQALLAASHAAKVIGTDVNPRALSFADFNSRLNGITNFERRQGSLYETVRDEKFDLIIANPPFVISPSLDLVYRDSGMVGDEVSRRVIEGAAGLLREGGFCTVLCNWHHEREAQWAERPQDWIAGSGCDSWILRLKTDDPLTYAANWLRTSNGHNPTTYGSLLDEWVRYYKKLGINFISYGAIMLRRRSVKNWQRADTAYLSHPTTNASEQIQLIFANQDLLESRDDERQLLEYKFLLSPAHQLEHTLKAEATHWAVKEATLKYAGGLGFAVRVDRLVGVVLAGCDGSHLLGELIADLAKGLNVEFESVVPPSLAIIKKLLQLGFLSVAHTAAFTKTG